MPELWALPLANEQGTGSLYPFGDTATLAADTGAVLDRDVWVDAAFFPVAADVGGLALTRVEVVDAGVTFTVGTAAAPAMAVAYMDFDAVARGDTSTLAFADPAGRAAGTVVIDPERAGVLRGWARGAHAFPPGSAPLAVRCVLAQADPGVWSVNDQGGTLWVAGGPGVVLSVPEEDVLRVDVVGDPLYVRHRCGDSGLFTPPTPVRAIILEDEAGHRARITPDALGQVMIVPAAMTTPRPALRIYASAADAITFEIVQAGGN